MKMKSILFVLLFLFGCSNEKIFENKTDSFAELVINKENNEYYLSIKFSNNTKDTLGIYSIGRIREKNQNNTSMEINRIMYDIILEVSQEGQLTKSTDFNFDTVVLDNKTPELIIMYPDSTFILPISASLDIRKEFSINSNEFKIRAIFDPPTEFIKEDSLADSFLRNNINIKLISSKIETPFLKVE